MAIRLEEAALSTEKWRDSSRILVERRVGRTRLIRGNPDSPFAAPLREILTVVSGPVVLLAEEFERIDGIESAFLYGSFAARLHGVEGPAPRDIDVMVVGTPDVDSVYEASMRVEVAVHRPVNSTVLTAVEFKAESSFLDTVCSAPIVPVIGGCRRGDRCADQGPEEDHASAGFATNSSTASESARPTL